MNDHWLLCIIWTLLGILLAQCILIIVITWKLPIAPSHTASVSEAGQ